MPITVPGASSIASGGVNNYVMTAVDTNSIQGEANLTFDGSTLTLDGDLTFTGAQAIATSTGNLTITAGSSTGDVLIGDGDGTILYVDGGLGSVLIGAASSAVTAKLLIESTGTGPQSQLYFTNPQTNAADVGHRIGWFGNSSDQNMAALDVAWQASDANDTYMAFSTRVDGSHAERMRLDNDGNLDLENNDLLNVGTSGSVWDSGGIEQVDGAAGTPSYSFTADTNTGMYRRGTDTLTLATNGQNSLNVVGTGGPGNITIGAVTAHGTTAGTGILSLFNGTAPVGTLANGASFYAASGEMFVIDAGGTASQLSPHNPETHEWWFNSKDKEGRVFRIHTERLLRRLDEMLGGGFIEEYIED